MWESLAPYRKAIVSAVTSYAGAVLLALSLVASDGITAAELLAALGGPLVPAGAAGAGTYKVRNRSAAGTE